MQYAQPLGSGSRPSWSRLTWADSRRGRRRTLTTGTLRRLRARERWGGPVREAPGCAVRTPDSLLRGPVSTALTLTSLPPKHPAEIVGILRIFSGVWRRYTFNVSTMDTHTPVMPRPSATLAPRATSLPRVPARASVSEVMTLTCLRSEETAQHLEPSTARPQVRPREPGRSRGGSLPVPGPPACQPTEPARWGASPAARLFARPAHAVVLPTLPRRGTRQHGAHP